MKSIVIATIICLSGVAVAETTIKDVENVLKPQTTTVIVKAPEVLTNSLGPQLSETLIVITKEPKGSLVIVR